MTGKKIVVPALKHGIGSPIVFAKKAQSPSRSTCDGQPLAFAKNNPEGKEICFVAGRLNRFVLGNHLSLEMSLVHCVAAQMNLFLPTEL